MIFIRSVSWRCSPEGIVANFKDSGLTDQAKPGPKRPYL